MQSFWPTLLAAQVVVFEDRDAAGKGEVIKRITKRSEPNACSSVAPPRGLTPVLMLSGTIIDSAYELTLDLRDGALTFPPHR